MNEAPRLTLRGAQEMTRSACSGRHQIRIGRRHRFGTTGRRRQALQEGIASSEMLPRDAEHPGRDESARRRTTSWWPLLRGWARYFGYSHPRELAGLDGWTRPRLRHVCVA